MVADTKSFKPPRATLEDRLFFWLRRRYEMRREARRRSEHSFVARAGQIEQCGQVLRDDGHSDPDYCNMPLEWHTRNEREEVRHGR